jgi:proteasome lid subunit RPN8/RPN11
LPTISAKALLRTLVRAAARCLSRLDSSLEVGPEARPAADLLEAPAAPFAPQPLERVVLTDGVSRTLFEEYAAHRAGQRGDEETGWLLLGVREEGCAVMLATLPAGAGRDAGHAHVRFNSAAQALASRVVRQADRRLTLLGVVHTHPGSLRHPSDGDYRGDSQWVGQLRGKEGVFAIGTADGRPGPNPALAWQPKPHAQCLGPMRLSWYALAEGDRAYRPVPVELTLGPDLARPLRPVWAVIEAHAERLGRLASQQARVRFEVVEGRNGAALAVTVPLAEPGTAIRAHLEGKEARYYLLRDGNLFAADLREERVDQGVYLLLAELAAQD